MFLLRLKTEFSENLKLLFVVWLALGVIVWSFFNWWAQPLAEIGAATVLGALTVLGSVVILFCLISTMFKRDDLKHPQDFWATRPIRALTLYGAKFAFVFLAIMLPVGLLTTAMGLFAGVGISAVCQGLEIMVWIGFATALLALSAMAYPGGNRVLLIGICFFGGVILTCILIWNKPIENLARPHFINGTQVQWNLLVTLIVTTAGIAWQCLRRIRDKHRRVRPLAWAGTGALTVIVITFIPLPGVIAGRSNRTAARTLPAVTKATLDTANPSFGNRNDARFMSLNIELMPDEKIMVAGLEVTDSNLIVTGTADVPQQVDAWANVDSTRDASDRLIEARPMLTYRVLDHEPGPERSSSSGGESWQREAAASLPRHKIRIRGKVSLDRIHYRTINRGPLDQPFAKKENGASIAFIHSPDRLFGHEYSLVWKTYAPPLVTASIYQRRPLFQFRIESPTSGGSDLCNRFEGERRVGWAFFGSYTSRELKVSDREIESGNEWRQIRDSGYAKSVNEWKKEAQLVVEVIDRIEPLILPVDVEVEAPDPVKVRELLLEGKL